MRGVRDSTGGREVPRRHWLHLTEPVESVLRKRVPCIDGVERHCDGANRR